MRSQVNSNAEKLSGFLYVQDQTETNEGKNLELSGINFSELYINYYPKLIRFAKEYVIIEEDAENITQDIFLSLWERKDSLHLIENMNAYLFRLIRNKSLDHLRHKTSVEKYNKKVQTSFETELALKLQSLDRIGDCMTEKNVEVAILEAINSLPQKCREIFQANRIEGLKYKEISERLGISINTVENQMSIALKKLRLKLKVFLAA